MAEVQNQRNDLSTIRRIHEKLAIEEGLDGVDLRVFLYLSSRLTADGYTRVPQVEIAEALGRRKEHISRSIRKLKEKRIIREAVPKIARSSAWLINPDYGR